MKKREEMSDREIIIRLDERMEHVQQALPPILRKVQRHEIQISVLIAVIIILLGKSLPMIAEALARGHNASYIPRSSAEVRTD